MENPDAFIHAAELIEQSGYIIIATGAGIGFNSVLPDFRGDQAFCKPSPVITR